MELQALGSALINLENSSQFHIFCSLFSFILAWTFISLQIKEFRIMGLSINDSVYSCIFFFLTGLHFFHILVGLLLCCLLFWSSSFSSINGYTAVFSSIFFPGARPYLPWASFLLVFERISQEVKSPKKMRDIPSSGCNSIILGSQQPGK